MIILSRYIAEVFDGLVTSDTALSSRSAQFLGLSETKCHDFLLG